MQQRMEGKMSKIFLATVGIAVTRTLSSAPSAWGGMNVANGINLATGIKLATRINLANGINRGTGIHLGNGIDSRNGLSLGNGINIGNGTSHETLSSTTLIAVELPR